MVKRYYRDLQGNTASIGKARDGKFRLRIRIKATNKLVANKIYETFRGARRAMANWSDSWTERTEYS